MRFAYSQVENLNEAEMCVYNYVVKRLQQRKIYYLQQLHSTTLHQQGSIVSSVVIAGQTPLANSYCLQPRQIYVTHPAHVPLSITVWREPIKQKLPSSTCTSEGRSTRHSHKPRALFKQKFAAQNSSRPSCRNHQLD